MTEYLNGDTLISAVTRKIRDAFSKEELAVVYKNKPAQNTKTPFAVVHHVRSSLKSEMRNRSTWTTYIDVRFHNDSIKEDKETYYSNVGIKAMEALSVLDVFGGHYKASAIEMSTEEGVFHVFAVYNYKVIRVTNDQEYAKIRTLDSIATIKDIT